MARTNIQRAQQQMKAQYDKAFVDAPFEIGQRVWIFTFPSQGKVYPRNCVTCGVARSESVLSYRLSITNCERVITFL